jgi:peptidoglycan/LPS O-acetylase OafA/YrhL
MLNTSAEIHDSLAPADAAGAPRDARAAAPPSSRPARMPALDGIRGFAVLWVMLYHFLHGADHHNLLLHAVFRFVHFGAWGVDLFFVLSGFLITGILYDAKNSANYFSSFYARRALRIFPLYYGVLTACFIVFPLLHAFTPEQQSLANRQVYLWSYTSNLAMVAHNAPLFDAGGLKLLHFWSLAIEEQFYLVWPLVVLALGRRALLKTCGGLILVAIAARLLMHHLGVVASVASFFTLCRVDALAIGAGAALLARGDGGLRRWLGAARTLTGACGLIVAAVILSKTIEHTLGDAVIPVRLILFAAVMVLSVAGAGAAQSIFSASALRFLGKYSYALYVFHYMMLPLFNRYLNEYRLARVLHSFAAGMGVRLIGCLAASILVALLSWHLYEMHFLKLKRLFERRDARPARGMAAPPPGIGHDENVEALPGI